MLTKMNAFLLYIYPTSTTVLVTSIIALIIIAVIIAVIIALIIAALVVAVVLLIVLIKKPKRKNLSEKNSAQSNKPDAENKDTPDPEGIEQIQHKEL